MHLFELTDLNLEPSGERVPRWAHGCFRRRTITYFTGAEDTSTEVLWLQSRGLTADFRRPRGVSPAAGCRSLGELTREQLLALTRVEAGLGRTRWEGETMHWSDWASFQTHARWPEPGRLARVGGCLVEFAPSGAYVEDWRLEPSGEGPLIGLWLLDERDRNTGAVCHRGGGLVVCGRHAAFIRGRPEVLPEGGRLEDRVQAHSGDAAEMARTFAFDAAYGAASALDGSVTVALATLPWRVGQSLLSFEGFSYDRATGLVFQVTEEAGRSLERRFSIDTLERRFSGESATEASEQAARWLAREGDALLATVR